MRFLRRTSTGSTSIRAANKLIRHSRTKHDSNRLGARTSLLRVLFVTAHWAIPEYPIRSWTREREQHQIGYAHADAADIGAEIEPKLRMDSENSPVAVTGDGGALKTAPEKGSSRERSHGDPLPMKQVASSETPPRR
jgi:hypothetical protein